MRLLDADQHALDSSTQSCSLDVHAPVCVHFTLLDLKLQKLEEECKALGGDDILRLSSRLVPKASQKVGAEERRKMII
jgi:hypothetical protein